MLLDTCVQTQTVLGSGVPWSWYPEWLGWPAGSQAQESCPQLRVLVYGQGSFAFGMEASEALPRPRTNPLLWFLTHNCPHGYFVPPPPGFSVTLLRRGRQRFCGGSGAQAGGGQSLVSCTFASPLPSCRAEPHEGPVCEPCFLAFLPRSCQQEITENIF